MQNKPSDATNADLFGKTYDDELHRVGFKDKTDEECAIMEAEGGRCRTQFAIEKTRIYKNVRKQLQFKTKL